MKVIRPWLLRIIEFLLVENVTPLLPFPCARLLNLHEGSFTLQPTTFLVDFTWNPT